jgi:hypothetical protein
MVLSDSEFKAASCTICKGSLANSPNDKLETSTSRTSGTISRVDNADDDAGGAASRLVERSVEDPSRPGTVRTIRPTRGIALLALLGAWCLILLIWFSGGDASRIPPRLLGAILLAAPLIVTVWPRSDTNANLDS